MGDKIGRDPLDEGRQVRGLIGERVVFSSPLDPYLSIAGAASYSSLKPRTLRTAIQHPDPAQRLVAYRVGRVLLVRRSELDRWIAARRVIGPDLGAMVEDIVRGVTGRP